jgi:hypothetical protein
MSPNTTVDLETISIVVGKRQAEFSLFMLERGLGQRQSIERYSAIIFGHHHSLTTKNILFLFAYVHTGAFRDTHEAQIESEPVSIGATSCVICSDSAYQCCGRIIFIGIKKRDRHMCNIVIVADESGLCGKHSTTSATVVSGAVSIVEQ